MANKSNWASLRHALLGFLLVACGGAVGVGTVGGESHFLRHCGDGCGPGLDCVADLCTRGCVVAQDSCSDLDKGATCTAASIEPGAIAVCDAACTNDAACSSLGADFTCQGGFCREAPPSLPGGSGGTGGSTSTSQGGSSLPPGGSAGAPGGSSGVPMPQGGSAGAGPVWTPPERCQQAFDQGPCDANFSVFAYIDGSCLEVAYGGCEGNDNRFYELEECLAVCEGRPSVMPCPEGRVRHSICIECGLAGGCGRTIDACAVECLMDEDCNGGPLMGCADGVCQTRGCI